MRLPLFVTQNASFRRIVFAAYVAAVLGATLAPLSGPAYDAVAGLDKLVHVALFGGVALLFCWNLKSASPPTAARVVFFTTLFAASIEIVQGRLRYRSGDVWDLLAGTVGALLGVVAAWATVRIWSRVSDRPH